MLDKIICAKFPQYQPNGLAINRCDIHRQASFPPLNLFSNEMTEYENIAIKY